MRKLQVKHWQHPVIGLLGAWFAVSPWALRLHADPTVLVGSVVLGVALIASAVISVLKPQPGDNWMTACLGLVTAIAPWLLGFAGNTAAVRNAAATGIAVLLLTLWVLVRDGEFRGRLSAHLAH